MSEDIEDLIENLTQEYRWVADSNFGNFNLDYMLRSSILIYEQEEYEYGTWDNVYKRGRFKWNKRA